MSSPIVQSVENQAEANVTQTVLDAVKTAGKKIFEAVTAPKPPAKVEPKKPPLTRPTDPEFPDHLLQFDPKDTHVSIGGERWRPGATLVIPPPSPKPAVEHPDLEELLDAAAARQAAANVAR